MYPDFKERRDTFLIKCILNYSLTSLFYETYNQMYRFICDYSALKWVNTTWCRHTLCVFMGYWPEKRTKQRREADNTHTVVDLQYSRDSSGVVIKTSSLHQYYRPLIIIIYLSWTIVQLLHLFTKVIV